MLIAYYSVYSRPWWVTKLVHLPSHALSALTHFIYFCILYSRLQIYSKYGLDLEWNIFTLFGIKRASSRLFSFLNEHSAPAASWLTQNNARQLRISASSTRLSIDFVTSALIVQIVYIPDWLQNLSPSFMSSASSAELRSAGRKHHEEKRQAVREIDPCWEEREISMDCLSNHINRQDCERHINNVKLCKKFWESVENHRRQNRIFPYKPSLQEREQIKRAEMDRIKKSMQEWRERQKTDSNS